MPGVDLPQISRRRTTLVNLAFQYVGIVLILIQGILLTPLYLREISIVLYGGWLATGNILAWIELADPGLGNMLQQRVAFSYGQRDRAQLAIVIGTGLVVGLLFALVPFLFMPLSVYISAFVGVHGKDATDLVTSFKIAIVGSSISIASAAPSSINLGVQRPTAAWIIRIAGSLAGIAMTVALLLLKFGLVSIPIGLLVRSLIFLLGNTALVVHWHWTKLGTLPAFHKSEFREVLSLSTYTFLSRLGSTIVSQTDALIATQLFGAASAVVITLTRRPFDIMQLGTSRVGVALLPGLSHLAGERNHSKVEEVFAQAMHLITWTIAISIVAIVALDHQFIDLWVGERIFGGEPLVIAVGLATALAVLSGFLNQFMYSLGEIKRTSLILLFEGVLKVPLQLVFGLSGGLVGLPVGAFLATALTGVLYLPRLATNAFGNSKASKQFIWGCVATMPSAALGLLLYIPLRHLDVPWTWPLFACAATALGVVLLASAAAVDMRVRNYIQLALSRLWRRPAGTGAP